MKKLVALEIFFTTGDNIKIPVKDLKYFQIDGIKKDITTFNISKNKTPIYELENAEGFNISVLKEFLNTRNDFRPYDENMDIVKNITNLERIKNYDNLVGITLKYNYNKKRTIGIDWQKNTRITFEEEDNIITIKIEDLRNCPYFKYCYLEWK